MIAVIAVAVLTVLIVQHLPSSSQRSEHRHRVANHVAGSPLVIRPARPDGIPGPTARWAADSRLPVGGSRPAWLYPAKGRMTPIGGLPPLRSGYEFTRIIGGWAVQAGAGAGPWCSGCAAGPMPVYFLADKARSARIVGIANRVAPAAEPEAVWLTTYPASPQRASERGGAGFAQEFSASGEPLGPRVRLPGGYVIDTATGRGLLLSRIIPRAPEPTYELWDPGTRHVTRTFSSVIAASASQIAWTPECATRCQVRVLDVRIGRTTQIALRSGSAARGAFSPDGSLLALAVSIGNGGDGGSTAMQLEVASVPGGRLAVVPGTWASSDALSGFGWPAGDDSLVAELSFMTKVQVASWHPGSSRLAVAVVAQRQKPNDLVVG